MKRYRIWLILGLGFILAGIATASIIGLVPLWLTAYVLGSTGMVIATRLLIT